MSLPLWLVRRGGGGWGQEEGGGQGRVGDQERVEDIE
jgi:hypothetical protein